MRNFRVLLFLSFLVLVLAALGCTNSSVTSPDFSGDRLATMGPGGPGGPGGGDDPNCPPPPPPPPPPGDEDPNQPPPPGDRPGDPWGDFETDCVRFFNVDYTIDFPNSDDMEIPGRVVIKDADCDAETSDVLVRFAIGRPNHRGMHVAKFFPGTKSQADNGTVYSGEDEFEKVTDWLTVKRLHEYNLLVQEADTGNIISGTIHRYQYVKFTTPDGEVVERERDWYTDLDGVEVPE